MFHEDEVQLDFILDLTTVLCEVVVVGAIDSKEICARYHDQERCNRRVGVVVQHFNAAHEQVFILL